MSENTYMLNSQQEFDTFWQNEVVARLDEQRMVLLFVADDIPEDLEPAVKFLDEQLQNIDVLAASFKGHADSTSTEPKSRDHSEQARPSEQRKFANNMCLCGCGGHTGGRFVSGHDERLAQWLHRAKCGTTLDSDPYLTYAALRCELDPTLSCHEYTSDCIVRLAEDQAKSKRERERQNRNQR